MIQFTVISLPKNEVLKALQDDAFESLFFLVFCWGTGRDHSSCCTRWAFDLVFLMTSSAGMPGMLNFLTKSRVVFNDIYIYILYMFIYFIYDVVPTENLTKKRDSSLKLTLTLNFEDDREQFLESTTNILPPESFLEPWLRYEAIHSHFPPTVGEAQFTKFLSDCLLAAKWIEMCVLFFVSVVFRAVGVFVFWDTASWTILNLWLQVKRMSCWHPEFEVFGWSRTTSERGKTAQNIPCCTVCFP